MIKPNIIHERPDYGNNLVTEMIDFFKDEIQPLTKLKENPYPLFDPRHSWFEKERQFWQTKENNYFAFDKQ